MIMHGTGCTLSLSASMTGNLDKRSTIEETIWRVGDDLGEVCEVGDFILGYSHDYIALRSSAAKYAP